MYAVRLKYRSLTESMPEMLTRNCFAMGALSSLFAAPLFSSPQNSPESCPTEKAQMPVLGTFPMSNPGQDTYNNKVDDVRSDQRQKEIALVIERLALFHATKILVEGAYSDDFWTTRYAKYLAGEYKLGTNEIEQIGFKLAKRLIHSAIYPVDDEMWMDGRVPAEIAAPVKTPKPFTDQGSIGAPENSPPDWVVKQQRMIDSGTVLESLPYLNSQENMRPDQASCLDMLSPNDSDAA